MLPHLLGYHKSKCLFKIKKKKFNNWCFNITQLRLLENLRIPSLLICIYQSKILVDHEQRQSFQKQLKFRRTVNPFQVGKSHFLLKIINSVLLSENIQ